MRKSLILVSVVLLGAIPEKVLPQRIGLFFDPDAQTCSRQIGLNDVGDIWIIAFDVDQTRGPVVGAEFEISGYPSAWYRNLEGPSGIATSSTPYPLFVILGYKNALPQSGNAITLGRIEYTARSEVPKTTLSVVARAGSAFDTPILIQRVENSGCGSANTFQFQVVPATGSVAVINGECSVAIESRTWQGIKNLYRE